MGNRLSRSQSVYADDDGDVAYTPRFAAAGVNTVASSSALLVSESTTAFVVNYLAEAARILSPETSNEESHHKRGRKSQEDNIDVGESSSNNLIVNSINKANCRLVEFPRDVLVVNELVILDLSNNRLRNLPDDFCELKRLRRLVLHNNELRELPAKFGELKSLNWLDISHNPLRELPESFAQLSELKSFGASDCSFRQIPSVLYHCESIVKLGLFNNAIDEIKPQVANWTQLEKLDLSGNLLVTLPPEIASLKKLIWLNLTKNQLSLLPSELAELPSLQELGLAFNQLAQVPDLSGLKLINVPMFGNCLKRVPTWLFAIPTLTRVDLSDNQIDLVDISPLLLNKKTNLTQLCLRRNHIEEIILPLHHTNQRGVLQVLDLSENRLQSVPWRILLPSLKELRLNNNPFASGLAENEERRIPSLLELSLMYIKRRDLIEKFCIDQAGRSRCESCGIVFLHKPSFFYSLHQLSNTNVPSARRRSYQRSTEQQEDKDIPFRVTLCGPWCKPKFIKRLSQLKLLKPH